MFPYKFRKVFNFFYKYRIQDIEGRLDAICERQNKVQIFLPKISNEFLAEYRFYITISLLCSSSIDKSDDEHILISHNTLYFLLSMNEDRHLRDFSCEHIVDNVIQYLQFYRYILIKIL